MGCRWLFFSLCCSLIADLSRQSEDERRLYNQLLAGYESLARPVDNESTPVNVSLGLTFQQIVDIVEKEQFVILNVWLNFKWNDYRLRWVPQEYGGVTELRLPPSKLWKPDVLLYNSAGENFDSTYPSNVVVRSNGDLEWIPPGIVKGTCKIDITWFPFDRQKCDLKFGSWTFDGGMLILSAGEVNTATYTQNGEWTLKNLSLHSNVVKYDCCPHPYYDVTVTIKVKRRTLYYGINLIIPCLLISFMTLLDFTLPPEAGEKLSLGITIFMSLCVFLLMVAEAMPQTSDAVPLIGTYFSSIMIVVSASLVFTVLVLNIHHRNPVTHEMGDWIRTLFLGWLPWLLMMKRPGYLCTRGRMIPESPAPSKDESARNSIKSKSTVISGTVAESEGKTFALRTPCNGHIFAEHKWKSGDSDDLTVEPERCKTPVPGSIQWVVVTHLEPVLQGIYREMKAISNKVQKDEEEGDVVNDWKFAAMVVDRLSLLIFTAILVITTCGIIFAAPNDDADEI